MKTRKLFNLVKRVFILVVATCAAFTFAFFIAKSSNQVSADGHTPTAYTIVYDGNELSFVGNSTTELKEGDTLTVTNSSKTFSTVSININLSTFNELSKGQSTTIYIHGSLDINCIDDTVELFGYFDILGNLAITGTTSVGQTLTANYTYTDYTADEYQVNTVNACYTYQWYRGTEPIATATSSTYVLTTADLNNNISVKLIGTSYNTGATLESTSVFVGVPHHHGTEGEDDYVEYTIPLNTYSSVNLESGNYYLTGDMNVTQPFNVAAGKTVNICLNGHVINLASNTKGFITSAGNLTICDCRKNEEYEEYKHEFLFSNVLYNKLAVWTEDSTDDNALIVSGGCFTGMENDSFSNQGIIYASAGTLTLDSITFVGNKSCNSDVAFRTHETTKVTINDVDIINNLVTVFNSTGELHEALASINYESNNECELSINDLVIEDNVINKGFDNDKYGTCLTIGDCTSTSSVTNIKIKNNIVNTNKIAGLMQVFTNIPVTNLELTGNGVTAYTYVEGGLVFSNGCTFTNVTATTNTITCMGSDDESYGGLFYIRNYDSEIVDSTFSSNTITFYNSEASKAHGGIIAGSLDYKTEIINTTISNNTVSYSSIYEGGLIFGFTDLTLTKVNINQNLIFGMNFYGGLIYTIADANLVGDTTTKSNITNNIINFQSYDALKNRNNNGGLVFAGEDINVEYYLIKQNAINYKQDKTSNFYGGLFYGSGSVSNSFVTIKNTDIIENDITCLVANGSEFYGGIVFNGGEVSCENVNVTDNDIIADDQVNGGLFRCANKFTGKELVVTGNSVQNLNVTDTGIHATGLFISVYGPTVQYTEVILDSDSKINGNSFSTTKVYYGGMIYATNITSSAEICDNVIESTMPVGYANNEYNKGGIFFGRKLVLSGKINNNTLYFNHTISGGIFCIEDYNKQNTSSLTNLEIKNNELYINTNLKFNGAIGWYYANVTINNITVTGNSASNTGDYNNTGNFGLFNANESDFVITSSELSNNKLEYNSGSIQGGLICALNISVTDTLMNNNEIIFGNSGYSMSTIGGLLYAKNSLTIKVTDDDYNVLENNKVSEYDSPSINANTYGGLIYCGGVIEFDTGDLDYKFVKNTVEVVGYTCGGFIYCEKTSSVLNNLTFDSNTFAIRNYEVYGGIIYCAEIDAQKTLSISDLTIDNNTFIGKRDITRKDSCFYALINCKNTGLAIENSSISNNTIKDFYCVNCSMLYSRNIFDLEYVDITNNNVYCDHYKDSVLFTGNVEEVSYTTYVKLYELTISENSFYGNSNPFLTNFISFGCNNGCDFDVEEVSIVNNTLSLNQYMGSIIEYRSGSMNAKNLVIESNTITIAGCVGLVYRAYDASGKTTYTTMTNCSISKNTITASGMNSHPTYAVLLNVSNITLDTCNINENSVTYNGTRDMTIVLAYLEKATLYNTNICNNTYIASEIEVDEAIYFLEPVDMVNTTISRNDIKAKRVSSVVKLETFNKQSASILTLRNITIENNKGTCQKLTDVGCEAITAHGLFTIVLDGKIDIKNNTINNRASGIAFSETKENKDELVFTFESGFDASSLIQVGVLPAIANDEKVKIGLNGSNYLDCFESYDLYYYVKLIGNDIYFCGRILHNPTLSEPTFTLYLDDFTNGETTSYQWYKAGEAIEDQTTSVLAIDRYVFGKFRCIATVSNGLVIESAVIDLRPTIIANPSEENMYWFNVDKKNLDTSSATLTYKWYKNDPTKTNLAKVIDTTKALELSSGTKIYCILEGEETELEASAKYNVEKQSWSSRLITPIDGYPYYDVLLLEVELEKNEIVFASFSEQEIYGVVYKGTLRNSEVYNNTGVDFGGGYQAPEKGTYSFLISVPNDAESEIAFYSFVPNNNVIDDEQATTFSVENSIQFAEYYDLVSVYNKETNYFELPTFTAENRPTLPCIGIQMNLKAGDILYFTQANDSNSILYFVAVCKMIEEGYLITANIDTTETRECSVMINSDGLYTILSYGYDSEGYDTTMPFKVNKGSAKDVDVLTYETPLTGDVDITSKIDEDGYIVPTNQSDVFGFDVYLEKGECITILVGAVNPDMYILFKEDAPTRAENGIIAHYEKQTLINYVATKSGYYTVAMGECDDVLEDYGFLWMKAYTYGDEYYEEINETSDKLRNVEDGVYFVKATYTQGIETYVLKSEQFNFVGHSINYCINETVTGDKPSDTYRYIKGEEATLATPTCVRDGYVFVGWSTVEGSTTSTYSLGDSITTNEETTLYPVYRKVITVDSTAQSFVYGDVKTQFSVKGTDNLTGYTVSYKVGNEYTTMIPVTVGKYEVKIERELDNTYAPVLVYINEGLVITKAKVSEPTSTSSFTYNATEQAAVINGVESYMTLDNTSVIKATNVGTYTIKYTLDDNHEWAEGNDGVFTWVINKAKVSEPTSTSSFTYNATEQAAVINGVESYMTLDNTSVIKATNVGTYTIKYTLDDNHEWAEGSDGVFTWVINKAKVSEPTSTSSFTYNATEQAAVINGVESYMTLDNTSVIKATNVGTYTVMYTLDDNHEWVEGNDGIFTWVITKAQNSISCDVTTTSFDEDTTVAYPAMTALFGEIKASMNASDIKAPGIYPVTFTVNGTDNYDGCTYELTVVVNEKQKEATKAVDPVTKEVIDTNVVIRGIDVNNKEICLNPEVKVKVEVTVESRVEEATQKKLLSIDYYNMINENVKLARNERVGVIFDVKLIRTIDGVEEVIQPSDLEGVSSIKVSMQIPEDVKVDKVTRILHVHSAADIDSIEFDVTKMVNGCYEIEVSKLSEFAFIYETNANLPVWAIVLISILSLIIIFFGLFILWKREYDKTEEDKMDERKLKWLDFIYKPINELLFGGKKESKEKTSEKEEVKQTFNPNCPCQKIECPRHGKCDECREYHKDSDKPRPCER